MPTLKEIAQKAGVSAALISAYLNGRSCARMRAETRDRIDAALRETGYRPSTIARALRTGKSGIIGYLASSLQNEVSQPELVFFHNTLAAHGFKMMTRYTKNEHLLLMEGCQELISMGCDGLIVSSIDYKETLEFCRTLPVPVVGLCKNRGWSQYDFIIEENYRPGVESAMRHLKSQGHRNVVFLSFNWNYEPDPRYLVYREFFPEGTAEIRPAKEMIDAAWMKDILKRNPDTTAFFCSNDHCAMATLGALNELGFRVPEDFALIGFDDLRATPFLRLASISRPQKEMTESAVTLLESKLKKQSVQVKRIFPAEFIPRRSCFKTVEKSTSSTCNKIKKGKRHEQVKK